MYSFIFSFILSVISLKFLKIFNNIFSMRSEIFNDFYHVQKKEIRFQKVFLLSIDHSETIEI